MADSSMTASVSTDFAPAPLIQEEVQDFCPPLAQRVLLPDSVTRADAIFTLSKQLPTNVMGFPLFIYRSDLLPFDLASLTEQELQNTAIDIYYNEGYPTLETGTPFWEQFPWEPHVDFVLFQAFLAQAETTGIRQLHLLANTQQVTQYQCLQKAREFYWSVRAKAFDMFVVAAEQKRREHRIRLAEGRHYQLAEDLMMGLQRKFEDAQWMDQLSVAEALDYLDKLIKVQRVSLGLSGTNASTLDKNTPVGASVELIMRNLSRAGNVPQEDSSDFKDQLGMLLNDPTMATTAQELILKITSGKSA